MHCTAGQCHAKFLQGEARFKFTEAELGNLRLSTGSALALIISAQAMAQTQRDTLPVARPAFSAVIGDTKATATEEPAFSASAPQNAPNVLVFMSDDQGFSMSSTFGGPVPTPNFARLAEQGVRYNRFHTVGICSPTRASLLTGRNHHRVGTGFLTDLSVQYPGYNGHFPASTVSIAQTLRLNGYSTAMVGKHHNVPPGERTIAGPFDMWPTGLGFEHFFGFIGGDTDQFTPTLYHGTEVERSAKDAGEMLDYRLATDAINWIHNQKAAAPHKPFFIYYAPGSTHAPHQVPAEYIARFRGKFDQGWDKLREEIWRRQLRMGIIPPGTALTARPSEIPAWSKLTVDQKAFAARSMETAAAMLVYQDEQLGRVLNELERMGIFDDTLIIAIQGDNGAAAEAGPRGTLNHIGHMSNGISENDAWFTQNIEKLGGPEIYGTYPAGWAWAMASPLRWTKEYASMLGGIRNAMVMSWPGHVAKPGSVCEEFGHVVDVAPTVLEAANIPAPRQVYGVEQQPYDGISLLDSLSDCQARKPRSQYFELAGKIGYFENGWFLSQDDHRTPWNHSPPKSVDLSKLSWELYNLDEDFSQSRNIAARHPEKVAAMAEAWEKVARDNHIYPIDHNFFRVSAAGTGKRPKSFDYWGSGISVAASDLPFAGKSFELTADFNAKSTDSGPIFAVGSKFGGWSLYLENGKPNFVYALSTMPEDVTRITASSPISGDRLKIRLRFRSQGVGGPATVSLYNGDQELGRARIPKTLLIQVPSDEMIDVGQDSGTPVTSYAAAGRRFSGKINRVSLTFEP
ncbi:MAG: arylsulfatase [Novosphingobium sp.]|nr:arylsulfatase [Novosphingobium sp.]MCP5403821.1 arylsulfatase [Novosphingobium sp.]